MKTCRLSPFALATLARYLAVSAQAYLMGNVQMIGTVNHAFKRLFSVFLVVFFTSICLTTAAKAAISRVQYTTGNTGGDSGINAIPMTSLTTTPANGNTLIAVISYFGVASNMISSIDQSGVSWSRVTQSLNNLGIGTEIWYAPNVSGAGKDITVNLLAYTGASAVVAEYQGLLTANAIDRTAGGTGSNNTASTGATATTAQAMELWFAGVGLNSNTATLGVFTNSFVNFANATSTRTLAANNARVYALDKIVNAPGAAATGGSISASTKWAGAVATFKSADTPAIVGLNEWTSLSATAPNNTGGTVSVANQTVAAGTNRLYMVAVCGAAGTGATSLDITAVTLGSTTLHLIGKAPTSNRGLCYLGYLKDVEIPGSAQTLSVTYAAAGANVTSLHIKSGSYSGVDQNAPIKSSTANYNAGNSVTFGAPIDYVLNGLTLYVGANGNTGAVTMVPPTNFQEAQTSATTGAQASYIASIFSHTTAGTYPGSTSVRFNNGARSSLVVASLLPYGSKAGQTITVTTSAPATAAYGTNFTVAATATSGLPVTYSSGSPGVCTNSGATFTMQSGAGTCLVQYDQTGDATNNAAGQVTDSTTATQASQTITVTTAAPTTAGYGTNFNVAAHATSALTVNYGSGSPDICTNNGATFTMQSGTGTCLVHYDQPGNTNFVAAPQVANSTTAAKATPNCAITPYSVTYDATAHTASGICTGVGSVALSGLDLSGTTHPAAGTYSNDSWSFTDVTGNYQNASGTVTDAIAKATATCNVTGWSGTYDVAAHGASGSCTGIGSATLAGLSLGASFTNVPGDTANWSFTNANYTDQSGSVGITISRAMPTAALAVTNSPVEFDGAPHGATVSITTSSVAGTVGSVLTGGAATQNAVGTYPVTADFIPSDTANYNRLTGVSAGNFVINPTSTVSVTLQTSPAGRAFTVDGTPYTTARTFTWTPGSNHTIATTTPQAGTAGVRYAFSSWSDSGAMSHGITAPTTGSATYTATFGTEYQLATAANPAASGFVLPLTDTWYAAGSLVTVSITPTAGNKFTSWSGPVANPNNAVTSVTMIGPANITATLTGIPALTSRVTGKAGAIDNRIWTVALTNSSTGTATSVNLSGLIITPGPGATCTPTVKSTFPIPVADVTPGSPQTGSVTLDFTGCAPTNKFNVRITYSYGDAGGGTYTGSDSFYNMLR